MWDGRPAHFEERSRVWIGGAHVDVERRGVDVDGALDLLDVVWPCAEEGSISVAEQGLGAVETEAVVDLHRHPEGIVHPFLESIVGCRSDDF